MAQPAPLTSNVGELQALHHKVRTGPRARATPDSTCKSFCDEQEQTPAAHAPASSSFRVYLRIQMAKKVAQLTKVIYLLNTKNDEHAYEISALEAQVRAQLAQRQQTAQTRTL
jgi:hypothetical protein